MSPLTIVANYLIGLDKRQDRKSLKENISERKNLKEAVHYFEQAQKKYELLKPEELYYCHVKNLASLERGSLLIEISKDSNGPKKEIYQRYAADQLFALLHEEREISSQSTIKLADLFRSQGDLEQAKVLVSRELEKWGEESSSYVVTLKQYREKISFMNRETLKLPGNISLKRRVGER